MGGAVSSGKNNDELIDNLCHENYIQTPQVEKVKVNVYICVFIARRCQRLLKE